MRQIEPLPSDPSRMVRPRLYINHMPELDAFSALEFGLVDDGQPPERWQPIADDVALYRVEPGGRCLGFCIHNYGSFAPEECEADEVWTSPTFDVPLLGLDDAAFGEVVLAARSLLGGTPTINRLYFKEAAGAEGERALGLWLACLQTGDSMAHFGLGYTLFELGRLREAYRHLRHYAELAPAHPWSWCWLGKAAAAIGEREEARAAFRRAIELTAAGKEPTDAAGLLAELDGEQPGGSRAA